MNVEPWSQPTVTTRVTYHSRRGGRRDGAGREMAGMCKSPRGAGPKARTRRVNNEGVFAGVLTGRAEQVRAMVLL